MYLVIGDIGYVVIKVFDVFKEDVGIVFCVMIIVDDKGIVCLVSVNDLFVGCSLKEVL